MDDKTARATLRFSVKAEGRVAEVELASTVSAGAAASRRANTARFTSTSSGVFSWTWTVPSSAEFERCRYADPRCDFAGRGSVQKIVGLKFRQEPLDIRQSLRRRVLVLIP